MKEVFFTFVFLALTAPWCSGAEHKEIVVIFSSDISPYRQAYEGFKTSLKEKRISFQTTEYNMEKEDPGIVVQQISRKKSASVFTIGPEASRLAKERIRNVPVVFSMVLHPETFAGVNTTGVSLEIPFRAKLENIKKILPGLHKIGVIYSRKSASQYREIANGCRETGIQLVAREIESGKEFPDTFREMSWQIDAFLMVPDTSIYFPKSIEYLLSESLKGRLPVIGLSSSYTKAGALLSFDPDYVDLGKRAGEMAARIMEGESPANIRPSGPENIRFSLNLVVAERLGIKIPDRVLKEAGEVFGR